MIFKSIEKQEISDPDLGKNLPLGIFTGNLLLPVLYALRPHILREMEEGHY